MRTQPSQTIWYPDGPSFLRFRYPPGRATSRTASQRDGVQLRCPPGSGLAGEGETHAAGVVQEHRGLRPREQVRGRHFRRRPPEQGQAERRQATTAFGATARWIRPAVPRTVLSTSQPDFRTPVRHPSA